jgi:hypothetical protein
MLPPRNVTDATVTRVFGVHAVIAPRSLFFDPDDEFPLGDGTADTEAVVQCPYCGEPNEIGLDPGSGPVQDYIEDCQVCCRPWRVELRYRADGTAAVTVAAADYE